MRIDLARLEENLAAKADEPSVPPRETLPYLLEYVWRPLADGKPLRYRDIDFEQFEADDLRVLADYNDRVERLSWQLSDMLGQMDQVPAAHCRWRMFC